MESNTEMRKEQLQILQALHDAIPGGAYRIAALDGLPLIDWAVFGVDDWYRPKPVKLDIPSNERQSDMPLPEAEKQEIRS